MREHINLTIRLRISTLSKTATKKLILLRSVRVVVLVLSFVDTAVLISVVRQLN